MVDAAMLYATRWRPSNLADVYDLPNLVLPLYLSYSSGASKAHPRAAAAGVIGGVPVGPPLPER